MASDTAKALWLLKYLKYYTDKNNPTSMPLIDYYFEQKGCPDFFGTKNSKRRSKRELVKKLAEVLNSDLFGNPLPKEEWIIMYDGCEESGKMNRNFICNLYYNQPFSGWEIDELLKSVEKDPELSDERKKALTSKVCRFVSNKNYLHESHAVRRGMNPTDKKKFLRDQKQNNARLRAIIKRKQEGSDNF